MARKAEELAAVLREMYTDRQKRFILTQNEFKDLAGKGKMRKKFLRSVDQVLRKEGYVLIDLHKEKQMIGVVRIETIAQWDIPAIRNDTHEQQFSEEEEDESNNEEKLPTLDTSF